MNTRLSAINPEASIDPSVKIYDFVNIYGKVTIGPDCVIGAFVEIQPGVIIGAKVKISSHTFICTGVRIDSEAFIGHGVMFTNDKYPKSVFPDGTPVTAATTQVQRVKVEKRASIGSGSVILCNTIIGEGAVIGAGSVITKDVPPFTVVAGNPARIIRRNIKNEKVSGLRV